MPATLEALAQALDELIDLDPDMAERVIEKHLGRLALKKRLAARQEAKRYTEGHCAERRKPGGCQLHNLHCGYPACDRR